VSPPDPERRPSPQQARNRSDADEAQWERAHQAWHLRVETPADAMAPETLRTLYRVLRVKRFEREALIGRLPGVVRRGAHVDLAPLLEALEEAGIEARLERRPAPEPQERNTDR
jgi:hypothetical protein